MSRFYFKYTGDGGGYSNDEDWEQAVKEEVITHEFSTEDLYEVVRRMEQFLKGTGFIFEESLELVPPRIVSEESPISGYSSVSFPWPWPAPQADTEYDDKNFDPT